jgi:hypothetical protein
LKPQISQIETDLKGGRKIEQREAKIAKRDYGRGSGVAALSNMGRPCNVDPNGQQFLIRATKRATGSRLFCNS